MGDLPQLCQALNAMAMTRRIQGDFSSAASYFERALEVADRIGEPTAIAYITCLHGEVLYLMGQWEQASTEFERAAGTARELGPCWVSLYPSLGMGLLYLAQGNREETWRYLEEGAVIPAVRDGNLYVVR